MRAKTRRQRNNLRGYLYWGGVVFLLIGLSWLARSSEPLLALGIAVPLMLGIALDFFCMGSSMYHRGVNLMIGGCVFAVGCITVFAWAQLMGGTIV